MGIIGGVVSAHAPWVCGGRGSRQHACLPLCGHYPRLSTHDERTIVVGDGDRSVLFAAAGEYGGHDGSEEYREGVRGGRMGRMGIEVGRSRGRNDDF